MTIALTKTLDPERDYPILHERELVVVDAHFDSASPQHPMRRWEYAMALRALRVWGRTPPHVADVGGAGSPFIEMLIDQAPGIASVACIDPTGDDIQMTLAAYMALAPQMYQAVFCLSVIEHVDDFDQFLYHLSCLVAPGGLLFLTMDCWDQVGPDTAHFSHMRRRIFDLFAWRAVATRLGVSDWEGFAPSPFRLLGEADWTYHGAQLYGSYTFASLALIKRP